MGPDTRRERSLMKERKSGKRIGKYYTFFLCMKYTSKFSILLSLSLVTTPKGDGRSVGKQVGW